MVDPAASKADAPGEVEGGQWCRSELAEQLGARLNELSALLGHRCSLSLQGGIEGMGTSAAPRQLPQSGRLSATNATRAYSAAWGLEVEEDPFGGSRAVRLARQELQAGDLVEACPLLHIVAERHQIDALEARAAVCRPSGSPTDAHGDPACDGREAAFFPAGFAGLYRCARPGREEANLQPKMVGDELLWFARRSLQGGDELLAPHNWSRLVHAGADRTALPESSAPCSNEEDPPPARGSRSSTAPSERFLGFGHVQHGSSRVHRSGVFSTRAYAVGEVVEVCPVLKLAGAAAKAVRDYCMACGDRLSSGLYGEWVSSSVVLALGLGAVYNHREAPQLEWFYDEETEAVVFIAVRSVVVGEELFINYGAAYWQGRGLVPL